MIIPGFVITWLTFPGVIIHELAHKLFCHATGTKVVEVKYFRLGNPAGYVIHEMPSSAWKHLLIGCGPLFINTLLGLLIALMCLPLRQAAEGEPSRFLYLGLMWLAVSVAMHSFPSIGDAQSIWARIWKQPASVPVRLTGTPLVFLIYAGAVGSVMWLDLIYGVGVCLGIPHLMGFR